MYEKEEALAKISLNEIGFIFQQSNLLKSDSCCIGSRENRKSSFFMEDGGFVSEIQLGKFRNDDLKREKKLLKWVAILEF